MEAMFAAMHETAKPGAHAAAVRTSSGSASANGSASGWWSDAANNDAAPAMDAWQHQPASPSSFLMADGCPLPPYASPTSADAAAAANAAFIDAAADDAFTADVAAIFRRGSGDSTTSSLPLAQPHYQDQDAFRPPQQPITRRRSGGDARSMKTRRAENNRRAQQRWRDRQKERSQQAAAEIDRLQRQLHEAALARGLLAQRNATLERLLSLRATAAAQHAVADAAADAAPTEEERQQQLTVFRGRMPAELQESAWWLDARSQAELAAELGLGGEMAFTVRGGAPLSMTQAQVATMPNEEWGQLYQEYLNAMAGCLVALQGGDADATAADARLERLADEVKRLKLSVLLQHPNQEVALKQRTAGAAAQEAAALGHGGLRQLMSFEYRWKLLEGARLSTRQQEAIKAVRRRYLGEVAVLAGRRDELEAVLQQDPMAHDDMGAAFSCMQQAIAGIGETLCLEHASLLKAVSAVFAVMTPEQFAHVNVGTTPAHPNAMCIAETIAVVAGEPHAREFVRRLQNQGRPTDQLASAADAAPAGMQRQQPPLSDVLALHPGSSYAAYPAAGMPAASPFS